MANDAWLSDWSDEFVTWAKLPTSMVDHMRHSVEVSYYKYGTVLTKDVGTLVKNRSRALTKWAEDDNSDRLCDAANYDMFCYMLTGDRDYITSAEELGKQYDESKFEATSSEASTHVTRKTVSDWLRGDYV